MMNKGHQGAKDFDIAGNFFSCGNTGKKSNSELLDEIIEMMEFISIPWKSTHMNKNIHEEIFCNEIKEDKISDAEMSIIDKIKQEKQLSTKLMKYVLLNDKNRENRYLQSRLKNYQNEEDDNNSYTVSVIDSEMKLNFFIWANIFGVKEDDAINFAKESFRTQNTILSRAQYIRDHMNEKYGRSWHCIIMFNPRRHAEAFCAKDGTKLYFKIGKYEVLLYQT